MGISFGLTRLLLAGESLKQPDFRNLSPNAANLYSGDDSRNDFFPGVKAGYGRFPPPFVGLNQPIANAARAAGLLRRTSPPGSLQLGACTCRIICDDPAIANCLSYKELLDEPPKQSSPVSQASWLGRVWLLG